MSTPPDSFVRETALDPSRSFIVEAPAGSGKTELLIQRYLRLLAVVDRPESVVAVTFTRKAAAEMKQRVIDALQSAQIAEKVKDENERRTRKLAQDVLTRDALLHWGLIDDPSILQIQTIDSLCAMLTRQMPLLSDFGGSPRVEEHAEELYRIAARKTLAMLAGGDPDQRRIFRNVVSHFESDLSSLEKQMVQMLGKRDQWLELIAGQNENELRDRIDNTLRDCLMSAMENACRLWPATIPGCPPSTLECREQWRRFAEGNLLKDKPVARRNKTYTQILDKHPDFCAAVYICLSDLPLFINDDQWDLVRDFVGLLWFTVAQLGLVFEEVGEVDFTEVTQAAIRALGPPGQPTDLSYQLDYRIEHLLVDEFQDTSISQYKLIEALTAQWSEGDNRTLFLVGDPMQSIYGFRQAEVRLFLEVVRGLLGSVRLEHLRLTANFRSQPSIVTWVNRLFDEIMPSDDYEHGGVKFQETVASRQEPGATPVIEAFIEDADGGEEAEWVAQTAKRHLHPGKTVAVLVKARSHVVKTIQAMRKHGIGYEAIEIDELQDQQHVLDVLSITRAILHVGDRLSWLACLRAPWCGSTLADLSALVEEQPRSTVTVMELLFTPERVAAMSLDGRLRAVRTGEILAAAVREVGRRPIRELVESVWLSLGGPATLTHISHLEDIEVLFKVLDEFDEGGVIRDFSLLNEQLQFLYAKPQTGGDRVQIMTIHGAKGLEFDTVILPRLDGVRHGDDKPLLAWIERRNRNNEMGLLMAGRGKPGTSDDLYKFVSGEMSEKQRHEEKRLLYVAATRAKNHLFLSGNVKQKENGSGYSKPAGFLKMIWATAEPVFDAAWLAWQKSQTTQQLLPLIASPQTILRRLPADWQVPDAPEAVSAAAPLSRGIASSRKVTYEWVSDVARQVGTVVHEYLRHFAEDGVASWTSQRIASQKQVVESELRRLGTPLDELQKATAKVMRALLNVIESDRAKWILSPSEQAQSEWAIGGVMENKLFNTIVDRTLIDSEGRRWIIDFKTGEHGGAALEEFLGEEQRRYSEQMSTYAALLRMREDRPIMLGLYFPLLDAWREWAFAEESVSAGVD
jgi:ATP-dependent helicase/nuclease subunit A